MNRLKLLTNRLKPFLFFAIITLLSVGISCQDQNQVADIIFINGKVVTVDSDFSIHNAVAVKDNKIIAVGTNEAVKKFGGEQTEIIDVENKTIIPGIIDAHAHPEAASISETETQLPDLHNINDLLAWIKSQAEVKENGEWIVYPKLFYTRLYELRQPTLQELDEAAPNNPVF